MPLPIKDVVENTNGKLSLDTNGNLVVGDMNADQLAFHFLTAASKLEQQKRLTDSNFQSEPSKFAAGTPTHVSTDDSGEMTYRHRFSVDLYTKSVPSI